MSLPVVDALKLHVDASQKVRAMNPHTPALAYSGKHDLVENDSLSILPFPWAGEGDAVWVQDKKTKACPQRALRT